MKEIKRGKILNLRYYNSNKSGDTFFVNGFLFNMSTKRTDVIYTNGSEGIPLSLPVDTFEKNFTLS